MSIDSFATSFLSTAAGGSSPATDAVVVQSVWDFVQKGGPMMIPIGICSFVALAVFIERLVVLRRGNVIPPRFLPGLKKVLETESPQRGLDYCRKHRSPTARVFAAGIKKLGHGVEAIEKNIVEAGRREMRKLRRNLRVLQVIAAIAPLLGLLGTIFGMITAFQTVAISPDALGKTELLAKGIYEAMITTAAGLIVAIPVMIFYHYLAARVEKLVMEIDQMTVSFLEDITEKPIAAAPKTEQTPAGNGVARVPEVPKSGQIAPAVQ